MSARDPAHIILAHRLPHQLGRLVRALGPDAPVLLHVDARADLDTVARDVRGLPNVSLLPRHRCRWGGHGPLAAALDGLRAVLDGGVPAGHIVLHTGQDFPLRSPRAVAELLAARPGVSFLDAQPLPVAGWEAERGGRDRYERSWFFLAGRQRGLPVARRVPAGLTLHAGGAYWCLAREAAAWIVEETRRRPEIERFFRRVRVPDELCVPTLVMSGPHAEHREDSLRWVSFPPGASRPRTLTMADLPTLEALPITAQWARKFDEDVDARILDALEARIGATPT